MFRLQGFKFQNVEKVTNILKAIDLSYYVTLNIYNEADKDDEDFEEVQIKYKYYKFISSHILVHVILSKL